MKFQDSFGIAKPMLATVMALASIAYSSTVAVSGATLKSGTSGMKGVTGSAGLSEVTAPPGQTATAIKAANGMTGDAKYITVPVHYLTDRNLQGATYGNHRRYRHNCLHKMYYGTAFVTVRNSNHEHMDEQVQALNWKLTNEKGKRITPKDRINQERNPREHFMDRIRKALDNCKTDKLCVYVPGAEETFEDACLEAAELEYYVKRPVILYSWPSAPKLLDYFVDNNNSEWSQGHFRRFIKHLEDFKQTHPLQVVFVAHSMGNRFLLRAFHELYRKNIAVDLELVSADIDLDTCRHYLLGFRQVDNKSAIRFYVSNRDRMLKLSSRIFGGYDRLGEDVEHKLGPSRAVHQVIVQKEKEVKADTRTEEVKVATKIEEVKASAKSEELLKENEDSEDNESGIDSHNDGERVESDVFEVVDFTALDKGFTGHSMPYQLVADMVNGKKSAGFKVVADESKRSIGGKQSLKVLEVKKGDDGK
jgi:esterase/lipase superfamily enzyme